MKKEIKIIVVNTLAELREALDYLSIIGVSDDVVYVQNMCKDAISDDLTLRLVEETLTDGSKVYNIETR
jgi:hypothetical protein